MKNIKILTSIGILLIMFLFGYKFGIFRSSDPNSLLSYILPNTNLEKEKKNKFADFKLPKLSLKFSKKVRQKLDEKIKDVTVNHNGWMSSEINPPKYHKGTILFNGESIPVKMRLKGNTGLNAEYGYSLRVKTKSNKLLGIKSFNLQPPSVKQFEDEWLFHSLGEKMGLITLDYLFVELKYGNQTRLYNLEEHFHEDFIHKKKLPEGIILCYQETVETLAYAHNAIADLNLSRESFFIAKIKPYYKKKVLRTPKLLKCYNEAKDKLELFRDEKLKTSEVFNIEKLAAFFVLCDLTGNIHPTEYRNMKFYFNNKTKLLEPIPYDMRILRSLTEMAKRMNEGIIGEVQRSSPILKLMFSDSLLNATYIQLVNQYSTLNIDVFFKNELKQLDSIKQIIRINPISEWRRQLDLKKRIIGNQEYMKRKLKPLRISTVSLVGSQDKMTQMIKVENLHDLNIQLDSITFRTSRTVPYSLKINSTPTGSQTEKKIIQINSKLNEIKKFHFHVIGTKNTYSEELLQY